MPEHVDDEARARQHRDDVLGGAADVLARSDSPDPLLAVLEVAVVDDQDARLVGVSSRTNHSSDPF